MISKWRNRIVIYALITVFLAVMGYYLYASVKESNDLILNLRQEGTLVQAEMKRLGSVTYTDDGKYKWGYILPIETGRTGEFDGATITTYSKAECEQMGNVVEVYYMFGEDGNLISYDKDYVDNFIPWRPTQSIILWVLAGVMFALGLYNFARNAMVWYILKKGESSIGRFEEAIHGGSFRYFKVKYTFIKDGVETHVTSAAIYSSREVERLRDFGSFVVKYVGKRSFIDQKL